MKQIDARGRACPEPVIMTMEGIKENPEGVEVLVDNACAVENVTRFAGSRKYQVKRQDKGGEYSLTLTK
ncbi:MAG: sulfurtransferase TusA family protein [Bacillota bacterium]